MRACLQQQGSADAGGCISEGARSPWNPILPCWLSRGQLITPNQFDDRAAFLRNEILVPERTSMSGFRPVFSTSPFSTSHLEGMSTETTGGTPVSVGFAPGGTPSIFTILSNGGRGIPLNEKPNMASTTRS